MVKLSRYCNGYRLYRMQQELALIFNFFERDNIIKIKTELFNSNLKIYTELELKCILESVFMLGERRIVKYGALKWHSAPLRINGMCKVEI